MGKSISTVHGLSRKNLRNVLTQVQTHLCDMALNSPGLVIGSSAAAKVKIANTVYSMIDGVLYKKTTAEVAFTATTHDVTNAKFRIFLLSLQSGGTVTITAGTEGATLAAATLPTLPSGEVALGYVIINPTGTGNFDATSTSLGDATVVPNAVYINTTYPFNTNSMTLPPA